MMLPSYVRHVENDSIFVFIKEIKVRNTLRRKYVKNSKNVCFSLVTQPIFMFFDQKIDHIK